MAAEGGDKTEEPTEKKRRDSRKKGMAARSSELPQAVSLIAAAVMLPTLMPPLFRRMAEVWRTAVSPDAVKDPEAVVATFGVMTSSAMRVFLPLVLATTVASVVAQLALTGGKPNPYKLKPQWSNLNPAKGLKRMVSLQVLWDFGRTVAKLGLLVALTYGLYDQVVSDVLGGSRTLSNSLQGIAGLMADLLIRASIAAFVVGMADAIFNKRRYTKQIRMSKQEVREERKQQEVSSEVRGEIRRRQMALSRNRMISAVAKADVIITNPTHLAIALAYNPDEGAPKVLAKGSGFIADRIREEARTHSIPIRENKPLARAMYRVVEVDDIIPAEFFAAVAAVLATVYAARKR